jgi:GrpB-like predicted nucleotidyltransferase (UPF0157 family)
MITILPYQPAWTLSYANEAAALAALVPAFCAIEHIGSTAVPGLAAKPVIDMMAAVADLTLTKATLPVLAVRGYQLIDAGMRNRLFLQRTGDPDFNLHIVTLDTWPTRKERLMRDALIADPAARDEHAAPKRTLAEEFCDDMTAYTRAKTAFVQKIMDGVKDRLGLPRTDV